MPDAIKAGGTTRRGDRLKMGKNARDRGDAILQIDGKAVNSLIDFNRDLVQAKADRDVVLKVSRKGEGKVLRLRLIDERVFFNNDLLWKRLGLRLKAADSGGFLVESVEKGGPAARADIRVGMLLSTVDGERLDSIVAFARQVFAKGVGETLKLGLVWGERRGLVVYRTEGEAEVGVR